MFCYLKVKKYSDGNVFDEVTIAEMRETLTDKRNINYLHFKIC